MKLSTILCLTLLLALACPAQENTCALTIKDSPELRGFRLGMSREDARQLLEGAYLAREQFAYTKPDDYGFEGMTFRLRVAVTKSSNFGGVDSVGLQFLDNKITSIKLDYDYETQWRDVDEFIEKVAPALKLPPKWSDPPYLITDGVYTPNGDPPNIRFTEMGQRALKCNGFAIQAKVGSHASLTLFDLSVPETIQKRKEAKDAERKGGFKP